MSPHRPPRALILALCLLLAGPALRAQTLAEALEGAMARHPQAAGLAAEEAAAQARRDLADGLAAGPAALSVGNLNDRYQDNRGKDEWEVELAVPMWLPGQRNARQAEAEEAAAEILARRRALQLQLAGQLREAWWALADARAAEALARRRLATAQALADDVARRHRAGDLARLDANLAQGEQLAAEAELVEAAGLRLAAEQAYAATAGRPAPADLPGEPVPVEAPAIHPRLAALGAAERLARARLKVAEVSRREAPELAVRLVRERSGFADRYGSALGVKLTLPFASGPRSRQEAAGALAEVSRAQAEGVLAREQLELDRARSRQALEAARRQLDLAATRRALAADSLVLGEKSFALGESDLATLLRLQAAAHDAESRYHRLRIAAGLALSRHRQAQGVLP